jgi:heme exporter protein B
MNTVREVITLLKKDVLLEWRQRYAISAMILYMVCSIFIVYISFKFKSSELHPITWNVLFWIIMLFTAANTIAKSFVQESRGRLLYYYNIANPLAIIISKIIYNTLLMLFLLALGLPVYMIVLGDVIHDHGLYVLAAILGVMSFSATFTMISSIASKAGNSGALVAILGFPVIIPSLLLVQKISKAAVDGLDFSVAYNPILSLISVIVIALATSALLFPFLWRTN